VTRGGGSADWLERQRLPAARGHPAASETKPGDGKATALETHDTALGAALRAAAERPSPAHHRAVAAEYRRLRVLDAAFDHLTAAIRLDPRDAAAFDARARIWRDWGFPQLGMGDAVRAVHHAPESAAARNTWGTLLAVAGLHEAARHQFDAARRLDPRATYALVNLCYLDAVAGEKPREREIEACHGAVALDGAKD
jgi:tetratricopeptide (TPR) repeat protein